MTSQVPVDDHAANPFDLSTFGEFDIRDLENNDLDTLDLGNDPSNFDHNSQHFDARSNELDWTDFGFPVNGWDESFTSNHLSTSSSLEYATHPTSHSFVDCGVQNIVPAVANYVGSTSQELTLSWQNDLVVRDAGPAIGHRFIDTSEQRQATSSFLCEISDDIVFPENAVLGNSSYVLPQVDPTTGVWPQPRLGLEHSLEGLTNQPFDPLGPDATNLTLPNTTDIPNLFSTYPGATSGITRSPSILQGPVSNFDDPFIPYTSSEGFQASSSWSDGSHAASSWNLEINSSHDNTQTSSLAPYNTTMAMITVKGLSAHKKVSTPITPCISRSHKGKKAFEIDIWDPRKKPRNASAAERKKAKRSQMSRNHASVRRFADLLSRKGNPCLRCLYVRKGCSMFGDTCIECQNNYRNPILRDRLCIRVSVFETTPLSSGLWEPRLADLGFTIYNLYFLSEFITSYFGDLGEESELSNSSLPLREVEPTWRKDRYYPTLKPRFPRSMQNAIQFLDPLGGWDSDPEVPGTVLERHNARIGSLCPIFFKLARLNYALRLLDLHQAERQRRISHLVQFSTTLSPGNLPEVWTRIICWLDPSIGAVVENCDLCDLGGIERTDFGIGSKEWDEEGEEEEEKEEEAEQGREEEEGGKEEEEEGKEEEKSSKYFVWEVLHRRMFEGLLLLVFTRKHIDPADWSSLADNHGNAGSVTFRALLDWNRLYHTLSRLREASILQCYFSEYQACITRIFFNIVETFLHPAQYRDFSPQDRLEVIQFVGLTLEMVCELNRDRAYQNGAKKSFERKINRLLDLLVNCMILWSPKDPKRDGLRSTLRKIAALPDHIRLANDFLDSRIWQHDFWLHLDIEKEKHSFPSQSSSFFGERAHSVALHCISTVLSRKNSANSG